MHAHAKEVNMQNFFAEWIALDMANQGSLRSLRSKKPQGYDTGCMVGAAESLKGQRFQLDGLGWLAVAKDIGWNNACLAQPFRGFTHNVARTHC
jgi:hypothetical protein